MTDELKAIEQRAAERPDHMVECDKVEEYPILKADLHRAIELAKKFSDESSKWLKRALELAGERDKAQADVLKLRDIIKRQVYWRDEPHKPLLDDTEHYELYR